MSEYLCISVTFLDPRFHGRGDGGEPEWPPSPLRLLQALVAANADQIGDNSDLDCALRWLERQAPPTIIAPRYDNSSPYRLSVPNNAMDIVAKAWSRGNYFGKGDASPATHRTMKTIRPVRMIDGDTVHYLWPLTEPSSDGSIAIKSLIHAARRMIALGWGIDLVVGHGDCVTSQKVTEMTGERWNPAPPTTGNNVLRTPVSGTLDALQDRYVSFLQRIGESGFMPVAPLSQFEITCYRRTTDPITPPAVVFELRNDDGSFFQYSQGRFIHIAGMLRHLAKELMTQSPPRNVDSNWVERYVAGHRDKTSAEEHRQFSYLPLPSIGDPHADQAIRRVMLVAPLGDDRLLDHLARRLEGRQLKPENGDEFGDQQPPTLIRVDRDNVASCYTSSANRWASVTPVILPGHNDHKSAKTRKLIHAALAQAGVDQPCAFEWSAFSRFPKSLSAYKYDCSKRPTGYIRPHHLMTQTAIHLTLEFNNKIELPGPLVIGAGRHCGFGLMAEYRQ